MRGNNFKLAGKNFLQIHGMGMGQIFSPCISNRVVYYLEEHALATVLLQLTLWLRYRDDVPFLWDHGVTELQNFLSFLNNLHPHFKFSDESSLQAVPFLDVQIYKDHSNKLRVKSFFKPTYMHQYLHRLSCHLVAIFNGFIKGALIRLIRNNSTENDYIQASQTFLSYLVLRGYSTATLNSILAKVSYNNRQHYLKDKVKAKDTPLTFVVPYNPAIPPRTIKKVLVNHFHLIANDPLLSALFPEPPILALKRQKSLG
uniref:Reverse transcriptase domain-containing protein n=1 Tax=Latimeria chalumnae TaxID=7897 RepID=H3ANH1_LATCH